MEKRAGETGEPENGNQPSAQIARYVGLLHYAEEGASRIFKHTQ